MTNEDKILELLVQMQSGISDLRAGQVSLNAKVSALDEKVASLDTRMSRLEARVSTLETSVSDLKAEMNERFDDLESSLREAWKDIGIVEDRVDIHDAAIQNMR